MSKQVTLPAAVSVEFADVEGSLVSDVYGPGVVSRADVASDEVWLILSAAAEPAEVQESASVEEPAPVEDPSDENQKPKKTRRSRRSTSDAEIGAETEQE